MLVKTAIEQSWMRKEALETAQRCQFQLSQNQSLIEKWLARVQPERFRHVMIVGRGSSDHAGVFARYLIEIELGIPVSSAALSVATLYDKTLDLKQTLVIAISQSGKSPDLLKQIEKCQQGGALVLALVNQVDSPLAKLADQVIPLHAGDEISVAATKSYLLTLVALLQLVACWKKDQKRLASLAELPAAIERVCQQPSFLKQTDLNKRHHLIVLGRGYGFAIANEMALKLKEVLSMHAEAFSSAEFLHGPAALASQPTTVISVDVADASQTAHQAVLDELMRRGVTLIRSEQVAANDDCMLQPLLILLRFYLDLEQIASASGLDVDNPPGLNKVTETI